MTKRYYVNGAIEWAIFSHQQWIQNYIVNELIKQQRIYNKPHHGNTSYYAYKQVDNLVPTEKPPPFTLWKQFLKPSAVSLESPDPLSKISSAIPLETTEAEKGHAEITLKSLGIVLKIWN